MAGFELDVDSLVEQVGTIRFRGKEYAVPDVPTGVFFQAISLQEKAEKMGDDASPEQQVEIFRDLLGMFKTLVPDLPEEELQRLPLRALQSILSTIMQAAAGSAGEQAKAQPPGLKGKGGGVKGRRSSG